MSELAEALAMTDMAFFESTRSRIWSFAIMASGEWHARFGGQTLEQLRDEFPGMELLPTAVALARENERLRTPWIEVSRSRYIDQLECLPPVDWNRSTGGESFKSMERTGGDVTAIHAEVEGRFFECHDLHTLTHEQVIASVKHAFFAGETSSGH